MAVISLLLSFCLSPIARCVQPGLVVLLIAGDEPHGYRIIGPDLKDNIAPKAFLQELGLQELGLHLNS